MEEAAEKYLVQWVLAMHKRGLPLVQEMIIQKDSEIHRYMFGSTRSLGSVGWGLCEQFMIGNDELNLRTAQIINVERNEASLEGLRRFFCRICQHIMEQNDQKITVVEYG